MKATYYGHSAVELELNGVNVLFDPFITPNSNAKHIDVDKIFPDYIFLSHCHEDHVADMSSIQQKSGAEVVGIVETAAWVEKQGVDSGKVIAMNFGGTITTSFGTAKMVYALHTNSTPEGDYAGVPAGYLLKCHGKTVYFAGDTALTVEMQLLADQNIDWAFLPIGGFYTMDIEDAIKAAKMINCSNIIGIHYNTFPPIQVDEEEAVAKFKAAGINLHLLPIGESMNL